MLTLAQRIAIAEEAGYTPAMMAKAAGVSSAAVAQWKGHSKTLRGKSLAGLCELTGWSEKWWASGIGPREKPDQINNDLGTAHLLSPSAFTIPSQIKWGELMQSETLPARFSVAMPDDSLAGKIERGTVLIFDTGAEPTPGHGVLLKDKDGTHYVRRYVQIRGGQWQAQATSDAYATLDSERDGLVIVAAMCGRLDGAI